MALERGVLLKSDTPFPGLTPKRCGIGDIRKSVNVGFIFDALNVVEKRNSSINAHGIESIHKKDCEQLKKISEKMIQLIQIKKNAKEKAFLKRYVEKLIELSISVI